MKKSNLKTRKVKDFNLSLNCTVISDSEFAEKFHEFYNFISCTYTPRKSDNAFNLRSFYMLYSFTFIHCCHCDITFDEYLKLPRFLCVERGKVYLHPNCRD